MKLTAKLLRQIIKEEIDDVVGKPMYGAMPSKHPMIEMADDILSASDTGSYGKIMAKARKHARAFAEESFNLGQSARSSIYYESLERLREALRNYETSRGLSGLEELINAAGLVKKVYTPDNQMPLTDDDPDF